MAAVTSAVVAVGAAGYQIYNAEKQKKDAKDALKDFNQQELSNPFENLKISTLATDRQREAALSQSASSIDALQRGGTRSVLAGVPKLSESNILLQNLISEDIERQEQQRDILIAKGEDRIQTLREQRELGALQGIGQQLQTARQDSANGVVNAVSGALAVGSALNQSDFSFGNPTSKQTESKKPIETTPKVPTNNELASIFKNQNELFFTDFKF